MTKDLGLQRCLSRRCRTAALILGLVSMIFGSSVMATSEDQAKRMHDRLTGNVPSQAILDEMVALIDAGNPYLAALTAIDNNVDHSFYNVTLKNWSAPWTNRDFDAFADLNDYIATVIGFVRDGRDFRGVIYEDAVYIGTASGLPAYAVNNNAHYEALEAGLELNGDPGYSLKDDLEFRTQSSLIPALANGGASGVVTSRAGAKAFLIAGTNRAAFRFTMLNHLCLDMEQVHDVTRTPDRIRQDVSRSPGGDSRIFLNTCIGCHSGMDPMAQALAYHNYSYEPENDPTGENGQIEYTAGVVQPKYFNNEATFPFGFVTPNDDWANYWREGKNEVLGWDEGRNPAGSGTGASSMFAELAHSDAFAQCHVKRVFKTVCLRDPQTEQEVTDVAGFVEAFKADGNLKNVFASSANYCKGE